MLIMEMFAVIKNYYVLRGKLLKKVGEIGTICTDSSQRKSSLERETEVATYCRRIQRQFYRHQDSSYVKE